jgi:phage protein U
LFAALGEISFEVVGSPESFESSRGYGFAEHRVIESKPRLQWVGNDLERLKIELRLHSSFTDPGAQLGLLRTAAGAHRALPLVFGNGGFRGFFVIESIVVRSQQLSASGAPIAISAGLSLTEWAIESEVAGNALRSGFPVLGMFAASVTASGRAATAQGISVLLSGTAASGATSPGLEAGDVPIGNIVRSATR